jgi:hypothetical protein
LLKSYEDFSPKIEEANDLSNTLDSLQHGDVEAGSPVRRSKSSIGNATIMCYLAVKLLTFSPVKVALLSKSAELWT